MSGRGTGNPTVDALLAQHEASGTGSSAVDALLSSPPDPTDNAPAFIGYQPPEPPAPASAAPAPADQPWYDDLLGKAGRAYSSVANRFAPSPEEQAKLTAESDAAFRDLATPVGMASRGASYLAGPLMGAAPESVLGSAALGAGLGALNAYAEDPEHRGSTALRGAEIGGALGGAGRLVGKGLEKAAGKFGGMADENRLKAAGFPEKEIEDLGPAGARTMAGDIENAGMHKGAGLTGVFPQPPRTYYRNATNYAEAGDRTMMSAEREISASPAQPDVRVSDIVSGQRAKAAELEGMIAKSANRPAIRLRNELATGLEDAAHSANTAPLQEGHWMESADLPMSGPEVARGQRLPSSGNNDARLLTVDTPTGPRQVVRKTAEGSNGIWQLGVTKESMPDREQLAYELSRELRPGAPAVPKTISRGGQSFQEYVPGAHDSIEVSAADDWKKYADDPAQRDAFLLDLVSRNTDRHAGNMLWKTPGADAPGGVAIDHGLAFGAPGDKIFPFRTPFGDQSEQYLPRLASTVGETPGLANANMRGVAGAMRRATGIPDEQKADTLARFLALQKNPDAVSGMNAAQIQNWTDRAAAMSHADPDMSKQIAGMLDTKSTLPWDQALKQRRNIDQITKFGAQAPQSGTAAMKNAVYKEVGGGLRSATDEALNSPGVDQQLAQQWRQGRDAEHLGLTVADYAGKAIAGGNNNAVGGAISHGASAVAGQAGRALTSIAGLNRVNSGLAGIQRGSQATMAGAGGVADLTGGVAGTSMGALHSWLNDKGVGGQQGAQQQSPQQVTSQGRGNRLGAVAEQMMQQPGALGQWQQQFAEAQQKGTIDQLIVKLVNSDPSFRTSPVYQQMQKGTVQQ